MVSTPFGTPSGQSEYGTTPPQSPPGLPFPILFPSPAPSNQAVGGQIPAGTTVVNSSGVREIHPSEFVMPPVGFNNGTWFAITRGREVGIFNGWDVAPNAFHGPALAMRRFNAWEGAFTYYSFMYYDGMVEVLDPATLQHGGHPAVSSPPAAAAGLVATQHAAAGNVGMNSSGDRACTRIGLKSAL